MNVRLELTYHEIARRLLLKQQDEEICQAMGLKATSLKNLTKRPDFRAIIDELRQRSYENVDGSIKAQATDLTTRIKQDATESYDRLLALLRSSASESIVRDVAQDLLDRAGYGRAEKEVKATIQIGPLETSVLVDALRREREAHELNKDKDLPGLAKPIREGLDAGRENLSKGPTGPTQV